jgi:rhodanese-related sulfurtransferase
MQTHSTQIFWAGALAILLQGQVAGLAQEQGAPGNPVANVPPKSINVTEAEKLLAGGTNIVILDVRTPEEYAKGRLSGSTNINFYAPDFNQRVGALDKNRTDLVHCAVGGRSAKACDQMSRMQFKALYNLEGGIKAWEKAGKKVEH